MTILFSILLFLAVLIGFFLFLALIIKKEYSIERDITINKPKEEVFDYIKIMRNQEMYNVWVMKDPNVKLVYTGTDGTEGFTCAWEGNKQAGKGEQEFKKIEDGNSLNIELRFEKPFESTSQTYLFTKAVGANQTNLKWQMIGKNKFPMNLMNIIIDGLLGKDLAKSLENVKQILERN
ncbi:polyketide cyclase [Pedobacter frigiditerrae]|uniref:Polyketide cyclase n=1 Tax=Pedobacter frigiditerrae TaxID=2530452 RepID=A0A4R0MXF3_9SPHI|nr:SRPBCC family protein [Pedobacter frigiditerrae]TCC91961.1 polyketide cyclase [Pedobacter frigiditerrae]